MNSPTSLSAVIPSGVIPGAYDVIVINPDGAVGVLSGGLIATQLPLPVITLISPGSLSQNTDEFVTITGQNFRGNASTITICIFLEYQIV